MTQSAKPASRAPYSVHPGIVILQKWIADLPLETGRSLDQWLQLVKDSGLTKTNERREWLKRKYGLGTNSASWIAERAGGMASEDSEDYLRSAYDYVEEMYSGKKSSLRPIYDQLLKLCLSIGKDVKVCPCKTIVPIYRNHVFAQLKPTTNTRVDLGFALGNRKVPKRLIDTGGYAKKDRITHRMEIKGLSDINQEVKRWLKTAYKADA